MSSKSGGSKLERFIDENKLERSCASRLRGTSKAVQGIWNCRFEPTCSMLCSSFHCYSTPGFKDKVMEQGWNVIDNARNASAVVMSRLRKHEDEGSGRGGKDRERSRSGAAARDGPPIGDGASGEFRAGDWICDNCQAHNFSRRQECFKCGAPREGNKRKRSQSKSKAKSRSRSNKKRRKKSHSSSSESS